MMVRLSKIFLVASVALWALWGGLGNLMDYQSGFGAVKQISSMAAVENPPPWATNNDAIVHLGYSFIWVLKFIGGAMCLVGALRLWRARNASPKDFLAAKSWAIGGMTVLFFMLFIGFNLIATNVFMAFKTPLIVALDLSWVFAGEIGIVMLFTHMKEE